MPITRVLRTIIILKSGFQDMSLQPFNFWDRLGLRMMYNTNPKRGILYVMINKVAQSKTNKSLLH